MTSRRVSVLGATPPLTIEVPLPDRALCGNGAAPASRGAKIGRAKAIKAQRHAAELAAYQAIAELPGTLRGPLFAQGRVTVAVTVHRDPLWSARRLDDDNLWRGLKGVLDGLADAGVVANDRQFQMGRIDWHTAEPLRGKVVLTLTGAGEEG